MHFEKRVSRRHILAISAAAGGLALGSRFHDASAQGASRIEQLDPSLSKIIDESQPIQELASGLGGGPSEPVEGPVWWKEGRYLLFSDIHNNKRMKYTPGQGVAVVKESTNRANGLTRDMQGRLVVCEQDTRRVIREEPYGGITVIANNFQNRRLNKPNDVVVKSDGSIYFSDPNGNMVPEQWDLSFPGLYRVTPDLGTTTLLTDRLVLPNGLAFSPDDSVLYVSDTRLCQIRAFDVNPNGMLQMETDRVFADLRGNEPGRPDGMKVDTAGNVYCGGPGGIWIHDPQGKKLGRIVHGYQGTTNMAFGGDDWKTLYFTTRNTLGAVRLKIAGIPVPTSKRS